jgi:hypothetical protein
MFEDFVYSIYRARTTLSGYISVCKDYSYSGIKIRMAGLLSQSGHLKIHDSQLQALLPIPIPEQ